MKSAIVLAVTLLFSVTVFAAELELIPGSFPAAQKPAFTNERAALVNEKRTLDGKVAQYNRQCLKPKPFQEHKCSTDRLALFQVVDAYKNKVVDFNKRLAEAGQGSAKKTESKTEAK